MPTVSEKYADFYERREVVYNSPARYNYWHPWRDWAWWRWPDSFRSDLRLTWPDWVRDEMDRVKSDLRWNWPEWRWRDPWRWPAIAERKTEKRVTFDNEDRMIKSLAPRTASATTSNPIVIRLTASQEAVLQEHFRKWPGPPHNADIILLAAETGLTESDVSDWFAIRLAQWRKEQGLGGSLGLH